MNFKIKYIFATALLLSLVNASAQYSRSGYFLPGYEYRFLLNPSLAPDTTTTDFVSLPGLANANVAMNGTLDVSSVIYNVDGRTTTFMNPSVSAAQVMNSIPNRSRIGADVGVTAFATGFKAFKGYNTIAINARANVEAQLPRELFSMLKEGVFNHNYDISDVRANADAYIELSLGHSHAIGKKWRLGANLKILIGAAHLDAHFNKASLNLQANNWVIESDAEINAAVNGLSYKTDINERTGHRYVSGAEVNSPSTNGMGMALDLGATFAPSANWTLSMALLDLGFIKWNNTMRASTNGLKTFETNAYHFNVDDNADNSFSNEWDKIKDDISAIYELEDMGNVGSTTKMLGATLNIGIQYTLPRYRKMSFGLLNTTRIQGHYSWTDFRMSVNYSPAKWFDASANMSAGTFGVGFGWLVNFHPKGFGLFVGMDRTLGKTTKQFVPLNSNGSVSLGVNFPF